jgi:hypothetical protein
MQETIWLSPTAYVTGEATVKMSYPFASHRSTVVTCATPGDLKWISMGLPLPPNGKIEEIIICYEVSNPQSFISQVRLVEMTTPNQALVRHDDPTDLKSTTPTCYSSKVAGWAPTKAVTLELRLNFQNTKDQIRLGAVGVTFQPKAEHCVHSIAGLKALEAGVLPCMTVLGYYVPGDGGGGDFYWDATSAAPDDGGTIITPNGGPATGRWHRMFNDAISVKWFGAKGDTKEVADGAITMGSTALTSNTAGFLSSDVGKSITIAGAGVAGVPLVTTIAAVVNTTRITLSAPASTTVSAGYVTWGGTDDGNAITAAAEALQATGRGMLLFPPGVYRLFSIGQTYGRVAVFTNLRGVRVIGYGATLALDPARVWAVGETASMFHFIACSDVVIEGFTGIGPTPNLASGLYRGVVFVALEQGTTGVSMLFNRLDGWSAGLIIARRVDDPESYRSRGIHIGSLKVSNAFYGINGQLSGDDMVVDLLQTETVYRSYFMYGVSNLRVNIVSRNPQSPVDVPVAAAYGFNLENVEINYTNVDSTATGGGDCIWIGFTGQAPMVIQNVSIHAHIRWGAGGSPMGNGVVLYKFDDASHPDNMDRGHTVRNLKISGLFDASGLNKQALTTYENWGAGEYWSNIALEDITVINNQAVAPIQFHVKPLVDRIVLRNVVVPNAIDLYGTGDIAAFAPTTGQVEVQNCKCVNLDDYIPNVGILPIRTLIANTATVSVQEAYTGKLLTNYGAGSITTYHLPPADVGLSYRFARRVPFAIRIAPNGTDTIRGGSMGKYLSLDSDGTFVCLLCVMPGFWEVICVAGATSFKT